VQIFRFLIPILLITALANCSSDSTPATPVPDVGVDMARADVAPDAELDQGVDAELPNPWDSPDPPPHVREELAATSGSLKAGVATLALDPPVGIAQGGYGGRSGLLLSPWADYFGASQGTHGALFLKAIALEVGGEHLVLLKIPMVFSEDSLTNAMHADLKARYGLDLNGRVITGATHTHHGPGRFWRIPDALGLAGIDSADDEIIRMIAGKMADAVKLAMDDLADAEWGYSIINDWDPQDLVYRDRRSVNDPRWGKDPRLTLFSVRRPGGNPVAIIANFGMHGTILGTSNTLLSDDAAGGFEQEFESALFAHFGTPVAGMFMQAGGGDAAPSGGHLGHRDEQKARVLGLAGGEIITAAIDNIVYSSQTDLAVRSRTIAVKHAWIYGDSGEFDQKPGKPYEYGTLQCAIDPAENKSQEGENKACVGLGPLFENLKVPVPNPELNQLYLTMARLGPLFFMTLPGEPTHSLTEYARLQIAELAADHDVMVVGYSQDHLLYLTHPDDWYMGGYEAEFSIWGPWAGRYLVERQMELARDMLAGFNGPVYYRELPDLQPALGAEVRAVEKSLRAGTIRNDAPPSIERLEVLDITIGGGDPKFGTPTFTVEKQNAQGAFVPIMDPANPSREINSTRLDTVVVFHPDPPTTKEILAERDHDWQFLWQVPPTLPTGIYRIHAKGMALITTTAEWEATTQTFTVRPSANIIAEAALVGDQLRVRLEHPAEPLVKTEQGSYPLRGWSVFDMVNATQNIRTKSPLRIIIELNGTAQPDMLTSTWNEAEGRHEVDMTGVSFNPQGGTLHANISLAGDVETGAVRVLVQ
jgi:hypothetical protein